MKKSYQYERQIGIITLVEENGKLCNLRFGMQEIGETEETSLIKEAIRQLDQYLEGKRKSFDLPLEMDGTEFQKKVWQALREIPYGETISYKELAQRVGSPKGYRAVGGANNKNPIPIIVPCHRVIGANGTLVGFALGLATKEKLLELEKSMV